MTEFWLIRHGQTDWNKQGRYQGQADIPLNDTGLQQAEQVAEMLAQREKRPVAVYSSPLLRAKQTAQVVAQRLNLPLIVDPGLREICQGTWEGKPYTEVISFYNNKAANGEHPQFWHAPDGETVAEVAERISQAVSAIAQKHSSNQAGPVVLVMHALALAALICVAHSNPLEEVYAHLPENGSLTVLDWLRHR